MTLQQFTNKHCHFPAYNEKTFKEDLTKVIELSLAKKEILISNFIRQQHLSKEWNKYLTNYEL